MALCFNIPLIPHYLSGIILGQSDRVMIDRMIGRGQAGIYNLAYQFALVMGLVTHGVNASLVPWTYKAIRDRKYGDIGKLVTRLVLLFAGITLGIVSIAPELIGLIATADYIGAVSVIPPVAVGTFFTFVYGTFVIVEFYFEENKFIMIASSLAAITNIALNFLFIPYYGYIAAAYTTLFCYVILTVSHYLFMRRVCNKYINAVKIHNVRYILLISLGLICISGCLMLLYDKSLIRYIILLTAVCVCFIKRRKIVDILLKVKDMK
jgi:O-antigen/teichoic acid export membrane protein